MNPINDKYPLRAIKHYKGIISNKYSVLERCGPLIFIFGSRLKGYTKAEWVHPAMTAQRNEKLKICKICQNTGLFFPVNLNFSHSSSAQELCSSIPCWPEQGEFSARRWTPRAWKTSKHKAGRLNQETEKFLSMKCPAWPEIRLPVLNKCFFQMYFSGYLTALSPPHSGQFLVVHISALGWFGGFNNLIIIFKWSNQII